MNNSVLAGADRLCGSSVFPHLHRSATSPQRIHYMCFGDEWGGGSGGGGREYRRHFSMLLFLTALSLCFDFYIV